MKGERTADQAAPSSATSSFSVVTLPLLVRQFIAGVLVGSDLGPAQGGMYRE
jgi:hypothetical protein